MMDELELLKKDWQKKEDSLPKLSYDEIYRMILKKSSSFVKWIFYISIAEFVFWMVLGMISAADESPFEGAKYANILFNALEIITYLILLFFIVRFYMNYKKIKATDSAKALMQNIIVARKTVTTYVWIQLCLFAISMVLVMVDLVFFEAQQSKISEMLSKVEHPLLWYVLIFLALIATIIIGGAIVWLFYRLIYGILLKRLYVNYKELKKLEV